MKRILNYLLFMTVFSFMFIINSYAECSYQERKELLNKAKSVKINVSPKVETVETTGTNSFSEEEITITSEVYTFDFIISNLSDDLFIRYYTDLDGEEKYIDKSDFTDGYFKFNDNSNGLVTYYFEMRSKNTNCSGEEMYTKKVIKPIYNSFSEYKICQNELVSNQEYCKKFLTKNLNMSESDFFSKTNSIINKNADKKVEELNSFQKVLYFFLNNWVYFVITLVLGGLIIAYVYIKKKREKLI